MHQSLRYCKRLNTAVFTAHYLHNDQLALYDILHFNYQIDRDSTNSGHVIFWTYRYKYSEVSSHGFLTSAIIANFPTSNIK